MKNTLAYHAALFIYGRKKFYRIGELSEQPSRVHFMNNFTRVNRGVD